jgi:hypothetical protein
MMLNSCRVQLDNGLPVLAGSAEEPGTRRLSIE